MIAWRHDHRADGPVGRRSRWLTDVRQFCAEEINYLPVGGQAGANLGWPAYEGILSYDVDEVPEDAVFPVWTYPRGESPRGQRERSGAS